MEERNQSNLTILFLPPPFPPQITLTPLQLFQRILKTSLNSKVMCLNLTEMHEHSCSSFKQPFFVHYIIRGFYTDLKRCCSFLEIHGLCINIFKDLRRFWGPQELQVLSGVQKDGVTCERQDLGRRVITSDRAFHHLYLSGENSRVHNHFYRAG